MKDQLICLFSFKCKLIESAKKIMLHTIKWKNEPPCQRVLNLGCTEKETIEGWCRLHSYLSL